MKFRAILLFSAALSGSVLAQATDEQQIPVLKGEVRSERPILYNQVFLVELKPCYGGGTPERSDLLPSGSFEFRNVAPGCHYVRLIAAMSGATVYEQSVNIRSGDGPLEFVIPEPPASRRPISGVVSADEIRRPVSGKAAKKLSEAQRLATEGRLADAIRTLQALLQREPDIWQARLNLGVYLSRQGFLEEAEKELSAAQTMEPESKLAASNLAIVRRILQQRR